MTKGTRGFIVGADVEALCNTCGDVWHVVVAKVGEKITKVECKQCGKQHRFKPTGDAPEANLKPTRTVVPRPAGSSTPRPSRPSSGDKGIILDPNKPKRPYRISESFAEGEQIEHPKFGPGVVCAVEDTKIRVNFAEGTKTLLHRSGKT
ncbi:hypothetical protein ACNOYE_01730 [Nannocystaceae bacterium ST9]